MFYVYIISYLLDEEEGKTKESRGKEGEEREKEVFFS